MPQRTPFLETASWFERCKREMPWRNNPAPYRVWLSEIMLQQTTVAAVIPYFQRFIQAYPSLSALAQADEQSVLRLWAGLGYYSRARNLLETAKEIGADKNFPSTLEGLLALKGVGPYTAGAVASIAFGLPVPLVDTNVERVLGRFSASSRGKGFEKHIGVLAKKLVEEAASAGVPPSIWNQALMEIGSLLCGIKAARCGECPLASACAAYALGNPLPYPGDKIKAPLKDKSEDVTIFMGGGQILLAQNMGLRRKGLWDFPLAAEGEELGLINYRISNDRVKRRVFFQGKSARKAQEGESFFEVQGLMPPLTSPAQKILKKYEKIINKL